MIVYFAVATQQLNWNNPEFPLNLVLLGKREIHLQMRPEAANDKNSVATKSTASPAARLLAITMTPVMLTM